MFQKPLGICPSLFLCIRIIRVLWYNASISDPELGVLHTKCRACGSRVVTISNGVKCVECGWKDDRKLSSDYGNMDAFTTYSKV